MLKHLYTLNASIEIKITLGGTPLAFSNYRLCCRLRNQSLYDTGTERGLAKPLTAYSYREQSRREVCESREMGVGSLGNIYPHQIY